MNKLVTPKFRLVLLHPRYWLTWLSFGVWMLVSQLPYVVLFAMGKVFGWFIFNFAARRKTIVRRNIELCFPDKTGTEREQLVREHLIALGMSFFEIGIAWFAPKWRLGKRIEIEGMDNLQPLLDADEGILFLVPHFTALEVLGLAINQRVDKVDQTYRPHNNPVYDWIQSRARQRHNPSCRVLAARDVRGIARSLKSGRRLSFLPDQDYGRKYSIFVPFFGIAAATVPTMSRLAQLSKVKVVPLMCWRTADRQYRVKVFPPLDNFPCGDDVKDTTRVNQAVEACIHQCPAQYLWSHRRFKSRPPGEADLYQVPPSRSKQRKRERRRRERERSSTN